MAKITPIVAFPNPGYDTGETAKDKINEALKSISVDGSLSGDGTDINPLKNLSNLMWQFDTNTIKADPGSGKFRRNAGGTELYVNLMNYLGQDLYPILSILKSGAAIYLQCKTSTSRYLVGFLSGDAVNEGSYYTLPITAGSYGAFNLDDIVGFIFQSGASQVSIIDYENIFFEVAAPDVAYILRGFAWKVTAKTDYGGIVALTTSTDAAYSLNDPVAAGGYLKASSDTENARTVLIIQPV